MPDSKKEDNNASNPFDATWKHFEQFFGGKLPFMPSGSSEHLSWIENYVKDVLRQAMPSSAQTQTSGGQLHTEMFETHNSVVVKIYIPDRSDAKKMNVLLSEHRIRLENLPNNGKQTIRLNCMVNPSSCKAVYKNGILQLHIRKQTYDDYFHPVDVRFP
ncbi:Hsp20/alpha crystallin family protein [Paenibacillus hamazuiensis]|uniref:Hsp20/alpha crystallin family protein n=1 Tax=Paenibacillus hamazuiensis TaxID=2936508 RepID=UPI00200C26D3|nr:Hsp20/alpha crystallin family protein [Paenibacillus hamazuiensis]